MVSWTFLMLCYKVTYSVYYLCITSLCITYGQCGIFVLTGNQSSEVQPTSSSSSSAAYGSNIGSVFKASVVLFRFFLCMRHPVASKDIGSGLSV